MPMCDLHSETSALSHEPERLAIMHALVDGEHALTPGGVCKIDAVSETSRVLFTCACPAES